MNNKVNIGRYDLPYFGKRDSFKYRRYRSECSRGCKDCMGNTVYDDQLFFRMLVMMFFKDIERMRVDN